MREPIEDDDGDEPTEDRIPYLPRLPRERWLEALRPLTFRERMRACNRMETQADVSIVMSMIGQLVLDDDAARLRAIDARPPRMPAGDPPSTAARRQVNFRLGAEEHARLQQAARLFGMRPNVLARVLTVRGTDRALMEARTDR